MDEAAAERIRNTVAILNERQRRIYLANEAKSMGYGGISEVSKVSGVSRVTITNGMKEINAEGYKAEYMQWCRKEGGGRKLIEEKTPEILQELKALLEPHTRGDPMNPLRWSSRSTQNLEQALAEKGYTVSDTTIGEILKSQGYSLQANQKSLAEKPCHPDRDAQFEYIDKRTNEFIEAGQPVISIDTKKKENIGNFKNGGSEYCQKGDATKVSAHNFPDKELGKAVPFGVYDEAKNRGFVNVGTSSDTAEFAVESIRKWLKLLGLLLYPLIKRIYIKADSGGSNGYRVRLWKVKLQELANEFGIEIVVSHYPSGTSKWNKIEHRLWSFISKNWRGIPLISLAVIINLIRATKTKAGLTVECVEDKNVYKTGIKVTDEEMENVNIVRDAFHGEWNYTISPTVKH